MRKSLFELLWEGMPSCLAPALVLMTQMLPVQGQEDFQFNEPLGLHNFIVVVVLILLLSWAVKVGYQLAQTITIQRRLVDSRPISLERMSLHAEDFQLLIRQHFNQILRMRRTVPAREVARHLLQSHVQPESLKVVQDEEGRISVSFLVDSSSQCAVRLYWGVGVSACNALLRHAADHEEALWPGRAGAWMSRPGGSPPRGYAAAAQSSAATTGTGAGPMNGSMLEMESNGSCLEGVSHTSSSSSTSPVHDAREHAITEPFSEQQCFSCSSVTWLPAGLGQRYNSPAANLVDPQRIGFDLTEGPRGSDLEGGLTAPVPLIIGAMSKTRRREADASPGTEGSAEVTFVRFRREESPTRQGGLRAEVLHQVVLGDGFADRILGIYGFEEESADGTGEVECMICYDRPRSVILMPCRHCSVCCSCLRSLRDERCPLCRSTFSAYLLMPLLRAATVPEGEGGQTSAG